MTLEIGRVELPGRISELSSVDADTAGIDRFSEAMRRKLERKRREGYSGWNDPHQCSLQFLESQMLLHIKKDDLVDIGNFAMMLWNRRNPTGVK